jgi:hypothetical protein
MNLKLYDLFFRKDTVLRKDVQRNRREVAVGNISKCPLTPAEKPSSKAIGPFRATVPGFAFSVVKINPYPPSIGKIPRKAKKFSVPDGSWVKGEHKYKSRELIISLIT